MEEKEEKIRSKINHLHGYQVIHNEWQSLLEVVDWFYFSYSGHYTYWKQTGEMGRPRPWYSQLWQKLHFKTQDVLSLHFLSFSYQLSKDWKD